jgi:hypothetical protein
MTETTIILNRTARPDSIELGTPGKGGVLKVYFDAANPQEMEEIIFNAKRGLAMANTNIIASTPETSTSNQ